MLLPPLNVLIVISYLSGCIVSGGVCHSPAGFTGNYARTEQYLENNSWCMRVLHVICAYVHI